MLGLILNWLGSKPFDSMVEAYKARLASGDEAAKLAADLAAQQARLDAQSEQLASDRQKAIEGRWRPWALWGFEIAALIYCAKAWIFDAAFHLGSTDRLSPEMLGVLQTVVAFMFGHSAVTTIGRAIVQRAK